MIEIKFRPKKINTKTIFSYTSEELIKERTMCSRFLKILYNREKESVESIISKLQKTLIRAEMCLRVLDDMHTQCEWNINTINDNIDKIFKHENNKDKQREKRKSRKKKFASLSSEREAIIQRLSEIDSEILSV